MVEKIFLLKIPHDELINVVYYVCSDLSLFSRKFAKTAQDADLTKMVDISAPRNNTRTSLLKSAEASSLFFKLYIYWCRRHWQIIYAENQDI